MQNGGFFMQRSKQFLLWLLLGILLLIPSTLNCLAATTAPMLYPAPVTSETGTKWGYIDEKGQFVIKPIYLEVGDFQPNGLATVYTENEQAGVINTQGKYVIPPKYNYIQNFVDGRTIASDSQSRRVLDEKGQVIFETSGFIGAFCDGLALFEVDKSGSSQGYIDKNGKVILKPIYKAAQSFSNGKTLVELEDNSFALIDTTGKILHSYQRNDLKFYHGGFISFEKDWKIGYIDENGTEVIAPFSNNNYGFRHGLVVVDKSPHELGVMNKQGKYVIAPQYRDIFILTNGNIVVGKWVNSELIYAIADNNGKFLTGFNFYTWGNYVNGVMPVADKNGMYFLDEKGQKVTSLPTVKGVGKLELYKNLIRVTIDEKISYLDKKGNVIWKQNDAVKLQNGFVVKGLNYRVNRYALVRYPEVTGFKNKAVEQTVNQKLKELALQKLTGKTAIVTGGTDHYTANFSVKFYNRELMVLNLQDLRSFPTEPDSNIAENRFVYVNLQSGQFYTLKDLFKKDSNYLTVVRQIIAKQIAATGTDAANYKVDKLPVLVTTNLAFEMKQDALVIYFTSYDLYCNDSRNPAFTISYKELMNIIDINGGLWKAFNAQG